MAVRRVGWALAVVPCALVVSLAVTSVALGGVGGQTSFRAIDAVLRAMPDISFASFLDIAAVLTIANAPHVALEYAPYIRSDDERAALEGRMSALLGETHTLTEVPPRVPRE